MGTPNRATMLRCMHTHKPTSPADITDAMIALRDVMASAEQGRPAYVDEIHRWAHCNDGRIDAIVKAALLFLAASECDSSDMSFDIKMWKSVQPRPTTPSKLIPEPAERKTQPLW